MAALAPDERERIFPHLQSVEVPLGIALFTGGETPHARAAAVTCASSMVSSES